MKTLALLFGGPSAEYEVSLSSAAAVLAALDRSRYEIHVIGVTRDGRFLETTADADAIRADRWQDGTCRPVCFPPGKNSREMWRFTTHGVGETVKIDVIFPLSHGDYMEDGRLQGLLSFTGIPFVGCRAESAALAMNKHATKTLCAAAGIPVVPWFTVTLPCDPGDDDVFAVAREIRARFGYPAFVKPARAGSSIGAARVLREEDLPGALRDAAAVDPLLLIERCMDAREIEVAVLETPGGREISPCGEILPHGEFYDYNAKYRDTGSLILPDAPLAPGVAARIRTLADAVFSLLSCRGLARVDFFLDRADGGIYLNEVNTMPGFTDVSMFPKLATAHRSFTDLLTLLIEGATA